MWRVTTKEIFEKWASSKGFNLERKPDSPAGIGAAVYQDPITRAAAEGYHLGYHDGCIHMELFWKALYAHAATIVQKHGLWKEFEDGQEKFVNNSLEWQELATRSKP